MKERLQKNKNLSMLFLQYFFFNDFQSKLFFLQLLRDQFHYKPILTKEQFLQFGFAERKMQIVCDIINCVVKKHKELSNLNKVLIK